MNEKDKGKTSKKLTKKSRGQKEEQVNPPDDPLLEYKSNKTAHMNLLGKRFKIEDDMLGFGSFGRTYLGWDIKRKKRVAIKIVSNQSKTNPPVYLCILGYKSISQLCHFYSSEIHIFNI